MLGLIKILILPMLFKACPGRGSGNIARGKNFRGAGVGILRHSPQQVFGGDMLMPAASLALAVNFSNIFQLSHGRPLPQSMRTPGRLQFQIDLVTHQTF